MAMTIHLTLKVNGTQIKGDSSQVSLERADTIECLSYTSKVFTAREEGSGMATGRRTYEPVTIVKRIDKASPLIAKALCDNAKVDAQFKFYRPNPTGDGTTEQFYSVHLKEGRVSTYREYVLNTLEPASANMPPLEEVGFVFHSIEWTYTNGGITHHDTWQNQR